ncbi:MAG: stalk domain-containing protein [Peptococcaceae bacterium]|nr:stalk domain-containing protein [Peptococcaceae bacterium]
MPNGLNYFTVAPSFPTDPTMLALDSKGNLYLSPNAGALWIQAQYPTAASSAAQSSDVVHGATRAYLAPDFATSQLAVLASPGGLYSVNFSYGILGNSSPAESQLQFGDSVAMNDTNITPPAPPGGQPILGLTPYYAFAFGPNGVMYASNGDEIYMSQDNGVDWTDLYYGAGPVQSIVLSPGFGIAFSTATGVFLSTDGGGHFTQLGVPTASGRYVVRFSPNYGQSRTMAVIVPGIGVYLSTDGGRTWGDIFPHRGAVSLALTNNAVYVGTDASAGRMKGVYASFDQGKTWTSEGLTGYQDIAGLVALPESGGDTVYALPQNALVQTTTVSAPAPAPKAPTPIPAPSNTVVFTIGSMTYTVNSQAEQMDVAPFIDPATGRTYVPVRYLAEALGVPPANIKWNPETITLQLVSQRTVQLTIGDKTMTVTNAPVPNGIQSQLVSIRRIAMDTAPEIVNGRTMLPARWVAQELGYGVQWNAVNKQVILAN